MTRAVDQSSRTADGIEQEAAVWLIRMDDADTTEQAFALNAWLRENPRHHAAYIRLSAAWRRADTLRELAQSHPIPDPDLLAEGLLEVQLKLS
jgi:ferric-dicitrate binding protein FerR (iron transport regulator)